MVNGNPIFPATHFAVTTVGDERLSVFGVDDGATDQALAFLVVMTAATVKNFRPVLEDLVQRSPSLAGGSNATATRLQRPYVLLEPPSRAVGFTASVAEEHKLVTVSFVNIDTESVLAEQQPKEQVSVSSVAQISGIRVSLSVSTFLGWMKEVLL